MGWVEARDRNLENEAFGLGLKMQRQGGRQWGELKWQHWYRYSM